MNTLIQVKPMGADECSLSVTRAGLDKDRIVLRFPEGISFYDGGVFRLIMAGPHCPDWTTHPDDAMFHGHRLENLLEYEVHTLPSGDGLLLSASVMNLSDRTVERVNLAPCTQLAQAPSLDDPEMTRTFYRAGGRFVSMSDAERAGDPGKNQVSVTSESGMDWTLSDAETGYGWGMAKPDADAGFIAVAARNGKGGVATWWQRTATLCNNATSAIHCVHAEPYFDTLAPGEAATLQGELVWTDTGGLDDLWARYHYFRETL